MSQIAKKAMERLTGLEARVLFRSGKSKRQPTIGWCKGYKQANIAILHKEYADHFAKFSLYNPGCLPILYESKPGEKSCAIADDSDITTDLPGYKIWRNGEMEEIVDYATDIDWSELVTFYIGCSFSFDDLLLEHGIPVRNIDQNTNVSMYKSNVECYPVGPFQCNMVISMRPIPEHQLSLVADITSQMPDVHGEPVHIGNPDDILRDGSQLDDPDFGSWVKLMEGDVPVFWACGVTNSEALKAAKSPLALTHCPGMMFLSDLPQERYDPSRPDREKCTVIKYSDKRQRYSILSVHTEKIMKKLEAAVLDDPGNRGIAHLFVENDFTKSALALSHASSVALITGFPCREDPPYDETDGLPGVFSLAATLQALGQKVTLIVDRRRLEMNLAIMKKQVAEGILQQDIQVLPYLDDSGHECSLLDSNGKSKFDVVLATERCGRAENGRYYTMKAKDITSRLDPIDNLFEMATRRSDVITIGVGDGGNELGMGKVASRVKKIISKGETVACSVEADHVITAGVSNWGCHALAFALHLLRRCSIHDRYIRRATGIASDAEKTLGWAMPTVERERKNLEIVEDAGIRDSIKSDQKMSVDGMEFSPTHADKITELKNIVSGI